MKRITNTPDERTNTRVIKKDRFTTLNEYKTSLTVVNIIKKNEGIRLF